MILGLEKKTERERLRQLGLIKLKKRSGGSMVGFVAVLHHNQKVKVKPRTIPRCTAKGQEVQQLKLKVRVSYWGKPFHCEDRQTLGKEPRSWNNRTVEADKDQKDLSSPNFNPALPAPLWNHVPRHHIQGF